MQTVLLFLGLGVVWGSQWMLMPEVRWLPPLEVDAARFAVAGLVLLPSLFALKGRSSLRPLLAVNAAVAFLLLIMPELLAAAGARASAGWIPVTLSMTPLLIALLEGALGPWLLPAILGLGGAALLSGEALSFAANQVAGVLVLLLASTAAAYGTVLASRLLREAPLAACVSVQMLSAAAVLFLFSRLEARAGKGVVMSWSWPAVAAVVAMGAIGVAGGYVLFFYLLRRLGAVQVGGVQWLAVLVAVGESGMIFRQWPGGQMLAGGVLIVIATVWLLRTRREPERALTLGVTEVEVGR